MDFSPVALERAAAVARARDLADRIEWRHEDLMLDAAGRFDLVTAHYLHATWSDWSGDVQAACERGGAGRDLLVVGHLLGDHWGHGQHHAHDPGVLYTAEDVASLLDPEEWRDVVTETRDRDPEAVSRTANHAPDTVLRARRRSGARQAAGGRRVSHPAPVQSTSAPAPHARAALASLRDGEGTEGS